jgi:hypothetical protein
MNTLINKYQPLIDAATASGVNDLQVREQDGVLYIDGTAPTGKVKDELWKIYDKIDPNYMAGDVVMDVKVAMDASVSKVKVVTESSNLNIRKGPGTDHEIIGKAAHGEIITLVNRSNEQWWLVRTVDGEEGYAYAQYLAAAE